MRIRCVAEQPNQQQAKQLGDSYRPGRTVYPLTLGQIYTVLGLGVWDGVNWAEIAMASEVVVSVPLFLFEIMDGRSSRYWKVRTHEDGALTLWPPSFYDEFYHDRLSNGVPEVVQDFRELKRKMDEEWVDPDGLGFVPW